MSFRPLNNGHFSEWKEIYAGPLAFNVNTRPNASTKLIACLADEETRERLIVFPHRNSPEINEANKEYDVVVIHKEGDKCGFAMLKDRYKP